MLSCDMSPFVQSHRRLVPEGAKSDAIDGHGNPLALPRTTSSGPLITGTDNLMFFATRSPSTRTRASLSTYGSPVPFERLRNNLHPPVVETGAVYSPKGITRYGDDPGCYTASRMLILAIQPLRKF